MMNIEKIRRKYPPGTRIVLDDMKDPAAPPVSAQGTVKAVNNVGSVLVDWDNGSTLSVILIGDSCQSIDAIHKINTEDEAKITLKHYGKTQPDSDTICPRCGNHTSYLTPSQYAEIKVCDGCGDTESREKAGLVKKLPLMEWALVRRCTGE